MSGLAEAEIGSIANGHRELTPEQVRQLFGIALRTYASHLEHGEHYSLAGGLDISATEAVIVADAALRSANLEPFELALWQSWGVAPEEGVVQA